MKKILATVFAALVIAASAVAQVLPASMVKNTTWVGFGSPYVGDTMFYGFTDTLQARCDVGKFTIEGMLNTGFLANYDNNGDVDNFRFGIINQNPLNLHYGRNPNNVSANDTCNVLGPGGYNYSNAIYSENTLIDSYYVNFIYHINKMFDIGLGTKLNWQVGPSPRFGAWLWEPGAHTRQGGFSTQYDDIAGAVSATSMDYVRSYKFNVDRPGSADVVGFVHYANKYAKRALAARFKYDGGIKLEIGAAIPNGFSTDDPAMHFGFNIAPTDWLSIGLALEGAFESQANFYTGLSLSFKYFKLDAYFAADSLFTDAKDDVAFGTGATITFIIPNTKITLTPEVGFNFFENSNYDFAWYTGCGLDIPFTDKFSLNLWASIAFGSKDKRWADNNATKKWDGGHIFSIKPGIRYEFTKKVAFDAYGSFEMRESFDGENRKAWSSGAFLTCIF